MSSPARDRAIPATRASAGVGASSSAATPAAPAAAAAAAPAAAPAAPAAAPAAPAAPATSFLPASHWAQAPEPDDDADSSLGSDYGSSTASISSSILNYRTINGRQYHAERGNAHYWATNDEQQLESMDIFAHLCFLIMDKKLYLAPLEGDKLKRALDIGCGTGVWAIDFGDEFPECEVIGTDISPMQPSWVPPNVRFEIEDCTQDWTFPDNHFDYVHLRLLYGSISDWDALLDQAYRVTAPGGWIETFECSPMAECDDGTLPEDSAVRQWGKFFIEGGRKIGRPFTLIEDETQVRALNRLGLEDVQVFDFKCPLGAWPKDPNLNEIGRTTQAVMEQDYEGYVSLMASLTQGWDKKDVTMFCIHMRSQVRHAKFHAYFRFRCVWGRKPGGA